MFRKSLIFVAIATICIFSLAGGQKAPCFVTGCGSCSPVVTKDSCNAAKKMYVDKTQICACCNACADYIKKGEVCVAVFVSFPAKGGGVVSIQRLCAPGLSCGNLRCE